jgi:transposase
MVGLARSRWWLDGIRQRIEWLKTCSLAGVWLVLKRLKLTYKRGREYLHSPDPDYEAKLTTIAQARQQVEAEPERFVMVYEDELTYFRRPTLAQNWGKRGQDDVRAPTGLSMNYRRRIAACLNVHTGQLFAWQRYSFRHRTLLAFFLALQQAYPTAQTIFVVLDNWPVHFHATLLAGLAHSRIVLLRLPTYAPWTNPVEKVWRKLSQEVLHLHRFVDDWKLLQQTIQHWLDQFLLPSPHLLHYVGL